eukprot:301553-Amphidinium_carterae.1
MQLNAYQLSHCDVEEEVSTPPITTIHALQVQGTIMKDSLAQDPAREASTIGATNTTTRISEEL